VTVRRTIAIGVALLAVGLGSAACRSQAVAPDNSPPGSATGAAAVTSTPSPSGASRELDDIQTTLDAVDSEVASDGSG
jgi:hypothetical protein